MVAIKREKNPVPTLQQSNNGFGKVQKNRSAPPAAFVSNQKMLQVFRCDQGELDLLKYHLGKTYDSFHEAWSRDEIFSWVVDMDADFREMLNGERWQGEAYAGDLEKDLNEAKTKLWYVMKSRGSNALRREQQRKQKRAREGWDGRFKHLSGRVAGQPIVILDDD
ncbi:hypothetical protein AC578_4656 [Pseudocercospora eumusae]|uniref:Uncharacterized protein n=1 Tax=Pseudocercospora eumusae TaxID=321146 RepID=A0A139H7B4_9PEZI|nr:hypothetical protein AC578_4656 [Pseudocercospora eumusae]